MKKVLAVPAAAVLVLGLLGCNGSAESEPGETAPTTSAERSVAPTPSEPPAATEDQLTEAELTDIFTAIQFAPGKCESAAELVDSVYPGLEARYTTCLLPFGIGWEKQSNSTNVPLAAQMFVDKL